jgi:hypothetical protein
MLERDIQHDLAIAQLRVPVFSKSSDERNLQEIHKGDIRCFSLVTAGLAFRHLLVPDIFLPVQSHPDRKKVARERLLPVGLAFVESPLEGTFGYPVFEIHKDALSTIDARSCIAACPALYEAFAGNHFQTLRAQILLCVWIGGGDERNLLIHQRRSPTSFQAATNPSADLEIAAKRGGSDSFIDKSFFHNNHTTKVYHFFGRKEINPSGRAFLAVGGPNP